MKVRALRFAYFDNKRIREGTVFDMKDEIYSPKDENGNPVKTLKGKDYHPTWVEPVNEEARQKSKGKAKHVEESQVEDSVI
jgi:hypothetical protein